MKNEPQRETMPSRSVRRIVAAVVALGLSLSAMLGFAGPADAGCIATGISGNDCGAIVFIGPIEPSIHQWLPMADSSGPTIAISGSLR